jgi:TrmH family RNA methyltransferase
MPAARLTGKNHPVIRRMRAVAAQARRAPPDLVLAEGLRVLEEALRSPWPVEALAASASFGRSPREAALLSACEQAGARIFRVADRLMRSLSTVRSPQGALALVSFPRRPLPPPAPAPPPLIVAACGLQDPGNLGTLLRMARATGVTLVCTTPGTVSPRNPKAVRASAGALFHVALVEDVAPQDLRDWCAGCGIRIYRAAAGEGRACWEVDLRAPCAVLLGNESAGVDARAWNNPPAVRVPMAAGVESLNVAAAGAVIMYEAWRQRCFSARPDERQPLP